jgi:DNA-binding CsgD family transcriptional regulator
MGMEIPNHFSENTILSKFFLGMIFWTGPSLLWISRWGLNKRIISIRIAAFNFILFLLFEYFLIWHSNTLCQPVFKGITFLDILIFTWLNINGITGLWNLRNQKSFVVTAARLCIIILISAGLLWGFFISLENAVLGFTLGLTVIPVVLLAAQGLSAIHGKRTEGKNNINVIINNYRMSPREAEVFIKVTKGLGNKDIAFDLGISENTVKRHMNALFKKCSVDSRFKLAALSRI